MEHSLSRVWHECLEKHVVVTAIVTYVDKDTEQSKYTDIQLARQYLTSVLVAVVVVPEGAVAKKMKVLHNLPPMNCAISLVLAVYDGSPSRSKQRRRNLRRLLSRIASAEDAWADVDTVLVAAAEVDTGPAPAAAARVVCTGFFPAATLVPFLTLLAKSTDKKRA